MKTLFKIIGLFLLISSYNVMATTDPLTGTYKTIDDETGTAKSIVQIYQKNGAFYGKIIKLFRKKSEEQDPICDKCTGKRKNKKIIGMIILENLKKDGKEYSGGTIYSPKKGKEYDCKMWFENGKLKVRGYVAFFYRTQTWIPQEVKK
ncbi:MAG: DUF2147 domain-containing protein [Gammaproteobacteria bacterium]|nr:MAG: DUF2147 domain-containing protein [Gammaproteobacteria bacterium]